MTIYTQVVFARGSGLGNRLFPWARGRIFSNVNSTHMLEPTWIQPRVGPLLRGGIDFNAYLHQILLIGLFKKQPNCVSTLEKYRLTMQARGMQEPYNFDSPWIHGNEKVEHDVLIQFKGDADHFARLYKWHELIATELHGMTRRRWLTVAAEYTDYPIALNIRRARDFPEPTYEMGEPRPTGPVRTPLSWYINSLDLIRKVVGRSVNAIVVSDGTREDLAPILSLENVRFVRPGCAISDLLALASAKLLLAAGGSSFSAWASFLGLMPTVTFPGQSLEWFGLSTEKHGTYVGDLNYEAPSDEFMAALLSSLGKYR